MFFSCSKQIRVSFSQDYTFELHMLHFTTVMFIKEIRGWATQEELICFALVSEQPVCNLHLFNLWNTTEYVPTSHPQPPHHIASHFPERCFPVITLEAKSVQLSN